MRTLRTCFMVTVLCAALVMFGDAIAGDEMRRSAGLKPEATAKRFRRWFARLILAHLDTSADADETGD